MSKYSPVKLSYKSFDPLEAANQTLSPVILMHGVTASKEMWCDIPQIIANKTKRKVYAVDSRNHGDTEWTDEYNFDMNADDLLHFMDTISANKAILIGHSMGGITSIRTALKSPERIEMIFVEDMYVKKVNQEMLDGVVMYANLLKEALLSIPAECPEEDVVREAMKFIAEKMPEVSKDLFDADSMCKITFPLKRDTDGRYVSKNNMDVITEAMKNGDTLMTEPKGLYESPAYFIYGTVSPFKVNEDKENILKFFPNAELIPVENADHSIHIQFSKQFIDIIVERVLQH